MRKWCNTTIGFFVFVVGVVWKWPHKALEIVGTVLDMISLHSAQDWLISYVEKHPDLGADIGPWVLMVGGVASLAATHTIPPVMEKYRQWKSDDLEFVWSHEYPCLVGEVYDVEGDAPTQWKNTFRIGIRNNSGHAAKAIRVRLESMYMADEPDFQINPSLPAALRPHKNTTQDHLDLHNGEIEYWDIAKVINGKRIFICAFDRGKRSNCAPTIYRAKIAVYSENASGSQKDFCLGVTPVGMGIFVPWEHYEQMVAEGDTLVTG